MLESVTAELQKIFQYYNSQLFNNALPNPIITIQVDTTRRRAMGWCTLHKIWLKDGKHEYYEINICPEYLAEPLSLKCGIMLHEMIHLHCRIKNIKEISRNGSYHNSKFRDLALFYGLDCTKDKINGWVYTSLNEQSLTKIYDIGVDESVFSIARHNFSQPINAEDEDEVPAKKESNSRKYICPNCKINVRATKDVYIICGDCKQDMILVENKDHERETDDNEDY